MNKKGLLAGALVVVSVAAISIGSTFALLKDTTEAKVNVFTAAAGLEGQLKEDAFDGCDYGVARPDTFTDESLGIVKAQKVVPGRAIPKDPQVKNNSDASKGVSAWVAIKLEVKCDGKTGSDAMNEIKKFADINFSDTWSGGDGSPSIIRPRWLPRERPRRCSPPSPSRTTTRSALPISRILN